MQAQGREGAWENKTRVPEREREEQDLLLGSKKKTKKFTKDALETPSKETWA